MDLRSKDAIESSKQHDIKIGNILIAEFMEVHEIMHDEYSEYDFADNTLDVVHENELKYHLSWDWLMPVVKKIKTSVIDQDETDNPYNSEEWDKSTINYELLNNITETLVEIEIKSVYKLVVEFIKNQNN